MRTIRAEENRRQFLAGAWAGMPIVFGYIPVAVAYAIMARQAGFSVLETCLFSLAVYAGAGQMMATGMVAAGSAVTAIIITVFVLNLRHFIMSTCVIRRLGKAPLWQRLLCGAGVTDESFAVYSTGADTDRNGFYFLGIAGVSYLSWNIGTLIGAIASDLLPAILTKSLGISLYAMFIGILIPGLRGKWRLSLLVLASAGLNTLLCRFLSSGWALIIATLFCAGVGALLPGKEEESDKETEETQ